jgi:proteic killer suppression protein
LITTVKISKRARAELLRVPEVIRRKLALWVDLVETEGLEQVRKHKGFHDEPLKGQRQGQRSIRLNRSYRAIYVILADGSVDFVQVEEVNKHDY